METQRELIFHNTIPLSGEELKALRERAKAQKDVVLAFFKEQYPRNFTPAEVYEVLKDRGSCAILTSIRRCISDLTKEGRLIKCMWSESRKGQYGTLNRCWKFNNDYMPPLNPRKRDEGSKFGTWLPIPGGCSGEEVANFYKEHGMGLYKKDYVISEIKKTRKEP